MPALRKPPVLCQSLTGQLLIAMPGMGDPRFQKTVIYLCTHGPQGAFGLVVNKLLDHITLPDLLRQLEVRSDLDMDLPIHAGGPVETARGFVLHSADYQEDGTLVVTDDFALTSTIEVLRALARGAGPRHMMLALGYAAWSPGQLDNEFHENVWLHAPAETALVFGRAARRPSGAMRSPSSASTPPCCPAPPATPDRRFGRGIGPGAWRFRSGFAIV